MKYDEKYYDSSHGKLILERSLREGFRAARPAAQIVLARVGLFVGNSGGIIFLPEKHL